MKLLPLALSQALSLALLLTSVPGALAASAADDYLPTAAVNCAWPSLPAGSAGVVQGLEAARFRDGLETDFLVLIDGELFLMYRPGRFEIYYPLGKNVAAMATLPQADGTDAAVVVDSQGLVLRDWAPGPGGLTADTVLHSGWTGVSRLWVHEFQGVFTIYGLDEVAQRVRRVTVNGSTATALTDLLAPAGLVNFVPLEYDTLSAGVEFAWLYDSYMMVTTADQEIIVNFPCTPGDVIARVPAEGAQPEDLLAWSTEVQGARVLFTWSENVSGGPPYLPAGMPTDIVVYDYTGDGVADVMLSLDGTPDMELVQHGTWGTFDAPAGVLARLKTLPSGGSSDVIAACPADFDQDGDLDLMVAHQGSSNLHVQLSGVVDEERQRPMLASSDKITRDLVGDVTVTVSLPMTLNDEMSAEYAVALWVQKPGEDLMPAPSYQGTQVFASLGAGDTIPITMTFPNEGIDHEGTAVTYWIFVAAVETTSGGGAGPIIKRYPTRLISWQPATGDSPVGSSDLPVWNGLPPGGDDVTGKRRGSKTGNTGGGDPPP
jgi:hypothetical protein